MEVSSWCDRHNLPHPKDGLVPSETGRYLAVCMYRRPDAVPGDVLEYISRLMGRVVAEA